MSCDHDLANEWVHCSGKNTSYITNSLVVVYLDGLLVDSYHLKPLLQFGVILQFVTMAPVFATLLLKYQLS